MTDTLRSSAKMAREFLETIADGIGRVESGAGSLTRAGAAALSSRLPARWGGRSSNSTYVLGALVAAGVVAGTAALIYARSRASRGRRRR